MKSELKKVLIYTFCLLNYLANIGGVDGRLSGETSTTYINEEGSGINLKGIPTIDKVRMVGSNTDKYNNTFLKYPIGWIDENYNTTEDNLDIVFEDKRREDAYKITTAENSPHSILLVIVFEDQPGVRLMVSCTGNLLTRTLVLTAAHCLKIGEKKATEVTLYAGGNSYLEVSRKRLAEGSQLQVSTEFYIHPEFKNKNSYDVAVVIAPQEFKLTKTVNIISITDKRWDSKGYKDCTFTGFGLVHKDTQHNDDFARKIQELKIEAPCHCASVLDFTLKAGTYLCSVSMEDYGICTGDSGGGLICDGKVTGLAMVIQAITNAETCEMEDNATTTCGDKNTISVFEDAFFLRDWIRSFIKSPGEPKTPVDKTPGITNGDVRNKQPTGLLMLLMIANIF